MKFLRNLLATIVGLFVFTFIMFFLLIIIASSGSEEKLVELKEKTVLHLKLNKQILEREVEDPFEGLPIFAGMQEGGIGLMELKDALKHAADDPKIAGIFLETPVMMAGISSIDEIRASLDEFKKSGKFIYSYAEMYTEGAYYLASVSDKVYMNPDFAMLEFNGLNIETIHFKGLFDKLEIEPVTISVGDYKGADEPFVRKNMSEEVKGRFTGLLTRIHGNILKNVADSRSLAFDDVKNISDSSLVNLEQDAVTYGLVDQLAYRDEVLDLLAEKVGVESAKDLVFVGYEKYRKSFSTSNTSKNKIAVIMATGTIVPGKGDNQSVGSVKFAKEIRTAADESSIKAIVIRINTPGGGALASDVLWRELKLASEKKPVIASMSDQATSGGYYLAMACDTILAQKNTITGSVGLFAMLFNLKDFLGNKLGITTDHVSTGLFADMYNMTEPLSEYELNYLKKSTKHGYESFVAKAADGRGMTPAQFEPLAAGRLWSGDEALENGMVDAIGNLEDAIAIAASVAGVADDYRIRVYPVQKAPFDEIIEILSGTSEEEAIAKRLGNLEPFLKSVKTLQELKGVQARSLVEVKF
ncbi:MAG: signal peptide peptidase SppA [Cyclobacteriaceae bacterium]|nr:signal peptide peptidase SppA [Cyclobacteriaceae bacterium]